MLTNYFLKFEAKLQVSKCWGSHIYKSTGEQFASLFATIRVSFVYFI